MSAAELSRGGPKDRIDPKLLAAVVNRFVADSSEFLQGFALQAEASLLGLSARIQRLEQLVQLLERKVSGLDETWEAPNPGLTVGPTVQPPLSVSPAADNAPDPQSIEGSVPEAPPSAISQHNEPSPVEHDEPSPIEDEKYAKYRRMLRTGVPLLAIRQRLLMDATTDPSLDVSILDTFDGAAGVGAGAPAPVPRRPAAPAVVEGPAASTQVQPVVPDQDLLPNPPEDPAPMPEESPTAAVPLVGGIAGEAMRKALERKQRMDAKNAGPIQSKAKAKTSEGAASGESDGGAVQGSESSKRLPEKPESSKTSPVKPAPSLFAQVQEAQSTLQQQRQQQQQQQQQNQPSDSQTGNARMASGTTPVAAKHSGAPIQTAQAGGAPAAPANTSTRGPASSALPPQFQQESSVSALPSPDPASLPDVLSADAVLRMRRVVVQEDHDDEASDASGGW